MICILLLAGWWPQAYKAPRDPKGCLWRLARNASPDLVTSMIAKRFLIEDLKQAESHYDAKASEKVLTWMLY